MRELDQEPSPLPARPRCTVIGAGRLGSALAPALRRAGCDVSGPYDRGAVDRSPGPDVVLLCVPDGAIAEAARGVPPGPLVGHCSGATGLDVLAGHEGFSLHPLMTVTGPGAVLAGAGAAVAGTTPRARDAAAALARGLGLRPVEIAEEDRAAYHAAASIASNFLVALETAAEELAATAGVDRDLLVPLVRASVETWARDGGTALTGPVARGDEETVARQREAVAERAPELLGLWDALVDHTRGMVAR
jgi:predicted short-subunit dehydrogenase-like oxidoreductase (DUF2520 family)